MRFNYDAYEKVFPTVTQPAQVESAVDTFKPTAEEQQATDNKPGDEAPAQPAENKIPEQIVTTESLSATQPEGE